MNNDFLGIKLLPHNQKAYNRVYELWKAGNKACVIHPTGTGKSYIIAKILYDFVEQRKIVLTPSWHIIKQQQNLVPALNESTTYMTYNKLSRLSLKQIQALGLSLIIFDEFHRTGAREWSKGVQKLLDTYPDSKILGTSATPIRHFDKSRDMSDELFDGFVASELSLADAIVDGILPCPHYISALYSIREESERVEEEIKKSRKKDSKRKELLDRIEKAKINWQETMGMPKIIKKHLFGKGVRKIIVFCEDISHMFKIKPQVIEWFNESGVYDEVLVYEVFSGCKKNSHNLRLFKTNRPESTVSLLFTIDMFNEGLHIEGVGSVFLLRPTKSPTIFYQQIGRCIEVSAESPIIFDLVNNFRNINARIFSGDLNRTTQERSEKGEKSGISMEYIAVHIHDEIKNIVDLFGNIHEQLDSWEVYYEHLLEFVGKKGHANVPYNFITSDGYRLGKWVIKNRANKKGNKLSTRRIQALEKLPGWVWKIQENSFQYVYDQLLDFVAEKGHSQVRRNYKTKDGFPLGRRVQYFKERKRDGKLSRKRTKLLEKLPNWVWACENLNQSPNEALQCGYSHLLDFVAEKGHSQVHYKYIAKDGYKLGQFVHRIRTKKKEDKLSSRQIEIFEELPFWVWHTFQHKWNLLYDNLLFFIKIHGTSKVPIDYVTTNDFPLKGFPLGKRVEKIREWYRSNKLSEERIKALEKLSGWSW